ncbi:SDR family oxidoreductase [Methylocella sp. CPCC 101449]|uniref:SDR family oxidoreductase n=1 Tax=Methylocella sp. CPCC 101449 TaxID=2987531 RepID=UPI00288F8199|nr:SDR family oxidoreductase [Methylocella sp. CPCC 101449]MDT2023102.1 SDR family oxidoreductase [Methylocella sp. CPCC 101449]
MTAKLLQGKVILVTGAGRGVGREIALCAAREGAKVVVNDLGASLNGEGQDASPAQEVVELIKAQGGEAIINGDSVATAEGALSMVKAATSNFGRIDGAVHSAGILRDVIFHRMTPDDFEAVLRVHLFGAFNLSHACAPHFKAQEGGAFVYMTSTSGLIGSFGQANYAAAKMGIVGLSRAISFDMEKFKVRSNCIAPHAFSRMIETIPGKDPAAMELEMEKRRTKTRADQIAPLAAFLCSDAASGITGQIFGARGNEVYLYSQPRPVRTMHKDDGWTVEALAERLPNAWASAFTPAERTRDVIGWDPI